MLCYYFSLQNICIFFRYKHLELKLIPFFYPLYKLINLLSYEFVDVCIDSNSRNIQFFFSSIGENMHLKLQQEQVKSWRQLKLNAGEEIEHFYP